MHPYEKSQLSGALNIFHGSICLRNVCVNTNIHMQTQAVSYLHLFSTIMENNTTKLTQINKHFMPYSTPCIQQQ